MSSFATRLATTLRSLRRAPLFSFVTILTVALGVGATTAIFSVVRGVLLKPLPYPEADRLVGIFHQAPGIGELRLPQAPSLYLTYREESEVFVDSGMWDDERSTITELGEPEEVRSVSVTDGVLPLLGARAAVGRIFSAADDAAGSPETVMLSHTYWLERFAGDPAAVGKTLTIDGRRHEVIGVLPAKFRFFDRRPAIVLPSRLDRSRLFFGNFGRYGIGRLAPGVSLEQANAELTGLIEVALENFPLPAGFSRAMADQARISTEVSPLKKEVIGDVGAMLWLLFGTAGIVLLVACANVANLLQVRSEARHHELAVRTALGAGRRRITFDLLTESLVLGLAGGVVGVGLAVAAIRMLVALQPDGLPRVEEIGIDGLVLAFALAASVLASLVFGALPALKLGAANLTGALQETSRGASSSRRRNLSRNLLVGSQVAMALLLVIGCGLMVRSFNALAGVEPGFSKPEEVLTIRLSIPEAQVEDPAAVALLQQELQQKLAAVPGMHAVAFATSVPLSGWTSNDPIFYEDFPVPADQIPPMRRYRWISPNYFETMENPIKAGRSFTWADLEARSKVAIISETLAKQVWGDPAKALGRRLKPYPDGPWWEVVGVAGDERDDGLHEAPTETVYWPTVANDFFQPGVSIWRSVAFILRSPRVGQPGFLADVQQAVWAVEPDMPVANVRTLEEILRESMARSSFTLVMLLLAAGVALALGAVGIYGVTSYSVTQRTREIGVRVAFGARPRDVSRLVLSQASVLAGAGVAVGLVAAFATTRLMQTLLYGVGPADPLTFAAASAGVVATVLAASYLPARRAAAVDPIETLR